MLPLTAIGGWLSYVGLDSEGQGIILLLLTPPMAMAILLFRGHLFASLHGSSRRQRLFSHQFGTRQ
jgi:hypothetical protein